MLASVSLGSVGPAYMEAVCLVESSVFVYDVGTGALEVLPSRPSKVMTAAVSGAVMVTALDDKSMEMWERDSEKGWELKQSTNTRGDARKVEHSMFSPDGESVLLADKNGHVAMTTRLDSSNTDSLSKEPTFLLGHVTSMSDWALGGKAGSSFIATSCRDEKVRVSSFPNSFDINCFCFHPPGFHVAHILAAPPDFTVTAAGRSMQSCLLTVACPAQGHPSSDRYLVCLWDCDSDADRVTGGGGGGGGGEETDRMITMCQVMKESTPEGGAEKVAAEELKTKKNADPERRRGDAPEDERGPQDACASVFVTSSDGNALAAIAQHGSGVIDIIRVTSSASVEHVGQIEVPAGQHVLSLCSVNGKLVSLSATLKDDFLSAHTLHVWDVIAAAATEEGSASVAPLVEQLLDTTPVNVKFRHANATGAQGDEYKSKKEAKLAARALKEHPNKNRGGKKQRIEKEEAAAAAASSAEIEK